LYRIAEFDGKNFDDEYPRFLGIAFVEKRYIVLLDANNNKIKKCTLLGEVLKCLTLEKRPNRISRINDEQIAIFYENDTQISIVDSKLFMIDVWSISSLRDDEVIKGITAISTSEMIITTNGGKEHPRMIKIKLVNDKNQQIVNWIEKDKENLFFEMPRRATTTPDKSKVIVADENDRRLILLDGNGNLTQAKKKWNRCLYNVRGMAATNERVYIAASNKITTLDLEDERFDVHETPLIKFPSDVSHTRAVALDFSGKFLAVTQASDNEEIVRVFYIP